MRGALRIIRANNRDAIAQEIRGLPLGYELVIRQPKRSLDQNAKLWAMLSDIAKAAPEGRHWSTEVWKCAFMSALGHEARFETGLNGEPLPLGFKSSRMSKRQMADLITCIQEYGDRHGVEWSEPDPYEVSA